MSFAVWFTANIRQLTPGVTGLVALAIRSSGESRVTIITNSLSKPYPASPEQYAGLLRVCPALRLFT